MEEKFSIMETTTGRKKKAMWEPRKFAVFPSWPGLSTLKPRAMSMSIIPRTLAGIPKGKVQAKISPAKPKANITASCTNSSINEDINNSGIMQ
jgi:hypothetical protein